MMIYETRNGGHVAAARVFAGCAAANHLPSSDTAWTKQSLSTPGSEELAP